MQKNSLMIELLVVGQLDTNCYLIWEKKHKNAIIVDPGDDFEYISDIVSKMNLYPSMIIATHGHFDHILSGFALEHIYKIPFLLHANDIFLLNSMKSSALHFLKIDQLDPPPDIYGDLTDNQIITLGSIKIKVIHTPGHTPGSICLVIHERKTIISGDIIFSHGSIGRTDHVYSSKRKLIQSINILLEYPKDYIIYPGHGESFTIDQAKKEKSI